MDARRSVVIVQRFLPRYRATFYAHLRALLARAHIDLTLVRSMPRGNPYGRTDAADIDWAIDAPGRIIGVGGRGVLWQPLTDHARHADLVIVEQASQLLLNYRLAMRQALRGCRFAFWGHGRSFHGDRNRSSLGEQVKRWMSRKPHWWFAYNDLAAAVVTELGFPAQRITSVQNSTDTKALRSLVDAVSPATKADTRREFGLGDGNVGLFIGNLSHEKRFEFLFEAVDELHIRDPAFSLLIVGAGPEHDLVAALSDVRPFVSYVGNRFGPDLGRCFAVADVLLVPGWAGLVLVDSFAAGVPPALSRSFPHPPEVSYVIDGVNGLLVEDGGSAVRYARCVHRLLQDPDEHARLITGCATAAAELSIESMAARFADGISEALGTPSQKSRQLAPPRVRRYHRRVADARQGEG